MSFLLPKGVAWTPANWVSRGFFEDAIPHLAEAPSLANDVRFAVEAEVDTIDLSSATATELSELKTLLQKVLVENVERKGSNFFQPEHFPIYLQHIQNLSDLVDGVLDKMQA